MAIFPESLDIVGGFYYDKKGKSYGSDKLKAGAVTDRLFRLVAGVIETCLKRETTMK